MSSWRYRRQFRDVQTFVLFVGCPRSGHSLLASLLDAHPDVVLAHELDALKYVESGWTRAELYARILLHDREFTAAGRQWMGYDYVVPDQWQGRFRQLRVIGDKRGAVTTERLAASPDLLGRLKAVVGVPVRILHVTRNPFDNIVTMSRRASKTIDGASDRYIALCDTVAQLHASGEDVMDIRHEELVGDVPGRLATVCHWLGLETDADYLSACQSVAFDRPRNTRNELTWTPDQRFRIEEQIRNHPFLQGYTFETDG